METNQLKTQTKRRNLDSANDVSYYNKKQRSVAQPTGQNSRATSTNNPGKSNEHSEKVNEMDTSVSSYIKIIKQIRKKVKVGKTDVCNCFFKKLLLL